MMKRFACALAMALLAALLLAAPASAEFGFSLLDVFFTGKSGAPPTQAGSHPSELTVKLELNTVEDPKEGEVPDGVIEDLTVELPAGFTGTPNPVPYCSTADFLNVVEESLPTCPDSTVVGLNTVRIKIGPGGNPDIINSPVYNLAPAPGTAAKLGFIAFSVPVTVETGLNPNPPYNLISHATNIAQTGLFYGSQLTLWGNPADDDHDPFRGSCLDPKGGTADEPASRGDCPVSIPEKPFLTLPRSCTGPLKTTFTAVAWNTGVEAKETATTPGMTGCSKLDFAPQIDAKPTTDQAESPTGLDFNVDINDSGLTSPTGLANSDIKKAVVILPEGMTANPSLAEGLATCSPADLEAEKVDSEPGEGCPEASIVGTMEAETPLLEGKIFKGQVFIASQDDPTTSATGAENPFDSLLAIYMVFKHPGLGILVKLAGKVEPDPETGQLITTVDEAPQVPLSHIRFHLREGGRSPLITPPGCGTFTTEAEFTPWANSSKTFPATSSFQISKGVGGGPCPPGGAPPFAPGFQAGTINSNAGSYSPFYMRLTRRDGDQDMTRFSAVLPPGMTAKLAGVSQCSDAAIVAAKAKRGRQELASPSCPANSQIGRVLGGAGVGSQLTYVGGKLYLAGPYNGAPLSVVSILPAVAGPFDVGTVVVRVALQIDPRTAIARVDGARSDPIPHILAGIPLKVRDIRVYADRPNFTLNPTNCDPFQVSAELWGGGADVFSTADDVPVSLAQRFQAINCASLGFKPRLSLTLKGGTKRGGHPQLRGLFTPRPADANLADLVLRFPHSAFLDQAHIRTICTRVQFAADSCPPGAVYGHATVVTPILDDPLQGPIYLRSSNHDLPDVVADLHGLVDVEAVGRVDSKNGGIRVSFEDVPDAPITKVLVEMQGGKKGLIVNSRSLCARDSHANLRLSGQNGKRSDTRPLVKASCKAKAKRRRHRAHHQPTG